MCGVGNDLSMISIDSHNVPGTVFVGPHTTTLYMFECVETCHGNINIIKNEKNTVGLHLERTFRSLIDDLSLSSFCWPKRDKNV